MKSTLTADEIAQENNGNVGIQVHAVAPNGTEYRVVDIDFDSQDGVYVLELVR